VDTVEYGNAPSFTVVAGMQEKSSRGFLRASEEKKNENNIDYRKVRR
jgi:hypothetical protein